MMIFYDNTHQTFYHECLTHAHVSPHDVERKSLFYLLSLMDDLRLHIHEIYDFEDNSILPSGLSAAFQTSGTKALTFLAFNLYNGYEMPLSLLEVFAPLDRDLFPYLYEAINIRFNL